MVSAVSNPFFPRGRRPGGYRVGGRKDAAYGRREIQTAILALPHLDWKAPEQR